MARTDGEVRLSPGTLLSLHPANAGEGLIVETSRAPGAGAGRRAAALLPDHQIRPGPSRRPRRRTADRLVRLARASGFVTRKA